VPGLIGIIGAPGAVETRRRFNVACSRMLRHGAMAAESLAAVDGTWVLGHVRLARAAHTSIDVDHRARPRCTGVFHGVLYNQAALRNEVGAFAPGDSVGALIAALYATCGAGFVERLEGEFCLALADPDRAEVLLASDAIGNYPLYWRAEADGLIFSSDLSALLRATREASRLDLGAVADYLTIGAVLGDKTLAEGVHVLDPGTVLTYDVRKARVSLRSYLRLETFFHNRATDKSKYLEAVRAAFTTAVGRATQGVGPIGLSLSGGLDSRAILSAVNGRASDLRTYTLGVQGCADQAIAERLAGIAGTQHFYFPLDSTYLRDFLPNMAQMVSMTDGMYLSHGLTEMLAVRFLDRTGIAVLLRGHGGELAKAHLAWPLHTDQSVYRFKSTDELVPYLSARANYVTPNLPLSTILTPSAAASAGEGSRETFAAILKGADLTPAECCSYLYLRELTRKFTVPSLELFRTRVEVRLPYLDAAFLKVLLAAPSEWRDTTEIHRAITASGLPKLLTVRNSNTGARAGAGPIAEFVLDKCNTALRRLHVRGYRHYHNFDRWMRDMLLQTVEAELMAPDARVQAFVAKNTLARLIRETREGTADRSYLLQVLLILELWQRENKVEAAA
jgi:asparagine synthase (glutamine-hydrolysing)